MELVCALHLFRGLVLGRTNRNAYRYIAPHKLSLLDPWSYANDNQHKCHQEIHAIMRNGNRKPPPDIFEAAERKGQYIMKEVVEWKKVV